MEKRYNTQTFTPSDIKKGLLNDFLNLLLKVQEKSEVSLDIHISYDGYTTIIDWCDSPSNREWGGSFQFVSFDDEEVGKWVRDDESKKSNFVPASLNEEEIKEYLSMD